MSWKHHLPSPLRWALYRLARRVRAWRAYASDAGRYLKWSTSLERSFDLEQLEARITVTYHVIEKALSLAEVRPTFGDRNCRELLRWMRLYREAGHSPRRPVYREAQKALRDYRRHHIRQEAYLDGLAAELEQALDEAPPAGESTIELCPERDVPGRFPEFRSLMRGRHSIRHFTGDSVSASDIREAVEVASRSPSACNRQCWRVVRVSGKDRMRRLCELQQGNRGFGHRAGCFCLVTADVRVFHGEHERNQAFVDGGIFGMSLMLALHAKGLGVCPLNWSAPLERDRKLRREFAIPDYEVVIMCLAVGVMPDRLRVAVSERKPVEDLFREDAG